MVIIGHLLKLVHWTSLYSAPPQQHVAVSSETGTDCKRAVHILPECFLVVCVFLFFKLSLCNSNVSYCNSNIQIIHRATSSDLFHFCAVFSNFLPNNRLVPPQFGLIPLLRNLGSAIVIESNTRRHSSRMCNDRGNGPHSGGGYIEYTLPPIP